MTWMRIETHPGPWYVVETDIGTEIVPVDVIGAPRVFGADNRPSLETLRDYCEGEPREVETERGWAARYSAPGYMDCTDWCGPYPSEQEAIAECRDLFGGEDDS